MIQREKMTLQEALSKIETYLSAIYYGYETEIIDPTQALVLYAFLQAKSLDTTVLISKKYAELAILQGEYLNLFTKLRDELEEELPLDKINEKKIENICLQRKEEFRDLKNKIEGIKLEIRALMNEVKHYGYLSSAWKSVIDKILQEWKNS